MEDKELLELAAKAAGIGPIIGADGLSLVIGPNSRQRHWSPLADDGDALRLAVKLGLSVGVDLLDDVTRIREFDEGGLLIIQAHCHDGPLAATRRAIVRAAAEIGRTK